jgi:hypothetical protein
MSLPFDADLRHIIEESPFSEDFMVHPVDGGESFTIRGIFDESVLTGDDKKAVVTRPVPRIMLYEVPCYVSGKTQVTVRGKRYKAQKHEVDSNIGAVLFLI